MKHSYGELQISCNIVRQNSDDSQSKCLHPVSTVVMVLELVVIFITAASLQGADATELRSGTERSQVGSVRTQLIFITSLELTGI